MSLGAHEQQALDAIEDGLTSAAPELTVLLATFTRLAAGEEMPARERIRPAGWPAAEHIGRRFHQGGHGAHALRQRPGRTGTFLLLWLTVAISLITLAVMLNRSTGRGGCAAPWRGVCAGQAVARGVGLVMPPGLGAVVR